MFLEVKGDSYLMKCLWSKLCFWTGYCGIKSNINHLDSLLCHYCLKLKNCSFSFSSSWFSKFPESSLALSGLKTRPAVLKSLSQAAEAGKGVFSFRDSWQTTGKDFRRFMLLAEQAKYPSSCLELSWVWEDFIGEKKSSSSDAVELPLCSKGSVMCILM